MKQSSFRLSIHFHKLVQTVVFSVSKLQHSCQICASICTDPWLGCKKQFFSGGAVSLLKKHVHPMQACNFKNTNTCL